MFAEDKLGVSFPFNRRTLGFIKVWLYFALEHGYGKPTKTPPPPELRFLIKGKIYGEVSRFPALILVLWGNNTPRHRL